MEKSIGRMRHRFTIQETVTTGDGGGGSSAVWQDIANNPNVFAEIISLKTVEKARFSQIMHQVTHRIMLRYHPDLTLEKRLTDGTSQFAIEDIEDVGAQKRYLVCYVIKI